MLRILYSFSPQPPQNTSVRGCVCTCTCICVHTCICLPSYESQSVLPRSHYPFPWCPILLPYQSVCILHSRDPPVTHISFSSSFQSQIWQRFFFTLFSFFLPLVSIPLPLQYFCLCEKSVKIINSTRRIRKEEAGFIILHGINGWYKSIV